MKNHTRKLLKYLAVPGAVAALVLSSAGVANAASYTWQGYTRDSSWNCGPSGSSVPINGLYALACTKHIGASWQAILIVTNGGANTWIDDDQYEASNRNPTGSGNYCMGGTSAGGGYNSNFEWFDEFLPGQSYACFSPTVTDANDWVWGVFDIDVTNSSGGEVFKQIVSPAVLTGS